MMTHWYTDHKSNILYFKDSVYDKDSECGIINIQDMEHNRLYDGDHFILFLVVEGKEWYMFK